VIISHARWRNGVDRSSGGSEGAITVWEHLLKKTDGAKIISDDNLLCFVSILNIQIYNIKWVGLNNFSILFSFQFLNNLKYFSF